MADKSRILVIDAHPADIFDQSAVTMAHHDGRDTHFLDRRDVVRDAVEDEPLT